MADDESYSAFLRKANDAPSAPAPSTFDATVPPAAAAAAAVPAPLQHLTATYTSESDEPFEAVLLDYAGRQLPDAAQFAACVGRAPAAVERLALEDFDPRGEYEEVAAKVRQAGDGQCTVFRVEVSSTRAEYYVVSIGEGKLVGVRARAVES